MTGTEFIKPFFFSFSHFLIRWMDTWVSLLVALLLVVVASVLFFLRGSSKKKVLQEPVEEKETPVKAKKKPGKVCGAVTAR